MDPQGGRCVSVTNAARARAPAALALLSRPSLTVAAHFFYVTYGDEAVVVVDGVLLASSLVSASIVVVRACVIV